jgi:carbon-monoxide dehydrogenase large subunit
MQGSGRAANGIGAPVRRKEDFRLLTGRGRYGDDLALPGLAYAAFVRSPHAHARIVAIDGAGSGALLVLTGADYAAAGLGPIPHNAGLMRRPDLEARVAGAPPVTTTHWPLPVDKARFVGEPVAMVVADTVAAAKDAAERVRVEWRPLPAVSRAGDALAAAAPVLWPEAPGNLCIDVEAGDRGAAGAAHGDRRL